MLLVWWCIFQYQFSGNCQCCDTANCSCLSFHYLFSHACRRQGVHLNYDHVLTANTEKSSQLLVSNFHVSRRRKGIFYCHIFRISLFMRNLLSDIVETAKFEDASKNIIVEKERTWKECLSPGLSYIFLRNIADMYRTESGSRVYYLLQWQVSE